MAHDAEILVAEQGFFDALTRASRESLDGILTDDFILIDLSGARLTKSALMELVGSGQLKFELITPMPDEFRVRSYAEVAVVTGRTEMRGSFAGTPFEAGSRYTHVYTRTAGGWRLSTAQGTPLSAV